MDEASNELRRLLRVLTAVRQVDGQFPPQCLQILLTVALRPGVSQVELVAETGLGNSSVSRNVISLGREHRNGAPGYGFISQVPHPNDHRAWAIYLTAAGRDTVRRLLTALTGRPAEAFNPRVVR